MHQLSLEAVTIEEDYFEWIRRLFLHRIKTFHEVLKILHWKVATAGKFFSRLVVTEEKELTFKNSLWEFLKPNDLFLQHPPYLILTNSNHQSAKLDAVKYSRQIWRKRKSDSKWRHICRVFLSYPSNLRKRLKTKSCTTEITDRKVLY